MNLVAVLQAHLGDWFVYLLPALATSIQVAVLSIIVGAVVGLPVALMKMAGPRSVRFAANVYIEVLRGLPALVLLYFVYFGLPAFGIVLDALPAAVITFGLNGAAYMAEIYRGGLQAIDAGQGHAALALGLTPVQTLRYVLLPQSWRVVLPPAGSLAVALFKDSSLATTIALPELMNQANLLVGIWYTPFAIYLLVAVMYAAVAIPASVFIRRRDQSRRWIDAA
jgi:His/Glu/Gln/Arg/opine family amino acid ABC transporter permease subunit